MTRQNIYRRRIYVKTCNKKEWKNTQKCYTVISVRVLWQKIKRNQALDSTMSVREKGNKHADTNFLLRGN